MHSLNPLFLKIHLVIVLKMIIEVKTYENVIGMLGLVNFIMYLYIYFDYGVDKRTELYCCYFIKITMDFIM